MATKIIDIGADDYSTAEAAANYALSMLSTTGVSGQILSDAERGKLDSANLPAGVFVHIREVRNLPKPAMLVGRWSNDHDSADSDAFQSAFWEYLDRPAA